MNESEERRAELVVAGGDASKLLQFVEEALNVVALAIDGLLPPEPLLPVGFVGNVGDRTLITDVSTNTIGIVAFVGDDDGARIESVEQGLGARHPELAFEDRANPGQLVGAVGEYMHEAGGSLRVAALAEFAWVMLSTNNLPGFEVL